MSTIAKPVWRPLPNARKYIRILELLPGQDDEVIRVRFQIKKLSGFWTRYNAISYTWGDDAVLHEIAVELDGHVEPTTIQIRENLWCCLQQLRNKDEHRLLWADAICINQNDIDEKGQQVSIMGQIFHRALGVFLWLGRVDDGSDYLFKDLGISHWKQLRDLDKTKLASANTMVTAMMTAPYTRYWLRLWIVQEIVQARAIVVCYGSSMIDWDLFVGLVRDSDVYRLYPYSKDIETFRACVRTRLRWNNSFMRGLGSHVGGRLSDFAESQCSDPRDSIYALLAISTGPLRPGSLRIDYGISLLELYCRVLEIAAPYPSNSYHYHSPEAKDLMRAFRLDTTEVNAYIKARGGLHLAAKRKYLLVTTQILPWLTGLYIAFPAWLMFHIFADEDDPRRDTEGY